MDTMKRKVVISVILFSIVNVSGLSFDIERRLDELEEKQHRDMMDLRDVLEEILEMANPTRACTVVKRAFVEEKWNIRKTLSEIKHVTQVSVSTLKDEIVNIRSEIIDEVSEKLTSLPNLKQIMELCTQPINQLQTTVSGSATDTAEDLSSIQALLAKTQLNIELLVNMVNELKSPTKTKHVWFSEPNQNPKWQYVVSKGTILQCYKSSCYFIGQKANWNEAKKMCEEFGAQLAEVDSEEENKFLIELATHLTDGISDYGVYLGASDLFEEGTWRWAASNRHVTDGYNNFKGKEPNGKIRGNCLQLYRRAGWKWNDTSCSLIMGFVCEVTMD